MRFRPLIALLFCLACQRDERPAETATANAVADDIPVDGGTLYRRLDVDVVTLNPAVSTTRNDRLVAQYIFTPVLHLDRNLQPIPGLADSWDVSDDGLTYRFHLNKKATFSDGKPVRASDLIFTLRKIVDPASEALQIAGAFEQMDLTKTRAIDDHTAEIVFRQPLAMQLTRFTDVMVVPEHVYSKGSFRGDHNETAVGSGPYVLVKREPGKEVVIERRRDYWTKKPHIERVVWKVINDHGVAFNALKLGQIDETILTADTWVRERNDPEVTKTIDFQRFYTLNYNYIAWNTRHPALSDKRVRRALAMCVPIDVIINDLFQGTARAMTGPFTPDEWAYNPTVPVIRHDLDGARKALAEAGWSDANGDGVLEKGSQQMKFDLLIMTGSATAKQFAQMVQAELKKVGVQVNIDLMDGAAAIQRIVSGNYQAAYLSWDLDPDPDLFAIFHSSQIPPRGQNFVYYSNPAVDRLIEQSRGEMDAGKRKELFWRIHELLAEDQPYTWIVQVSAKWGLNKRVRGAVASRGLGYFLWYPGEFDWWLAPAR